MKRKTIEESLFISSKRTVADMINRYVKETSVIYPHTVKNQGSHLKWWKQEIGQVYLDVRETCGVG